MRLTLPLLPLSLALLGPASAPAQLLFHDPSPDHKFEAVCDRLAQPPFKIIHKASGETLATMDAEHMSRHGVDSLWSPNSQLLVVLINWRRWTEIDIFRLVGGRFERAAGPIADVEYVSLDRWTAPNKLRLRGDGGPLTLVITNHAAKFTR